MRTIVALLAVAGGCAGRSTEPPPAAADRAPFTPAPSPMKAGGHQLSADASAMLAAHDRVRADHCAAPLAWSDELAAVAQKWADHLRDAGCAFEHSRTDYGENLAAGTEGTLDPDAVVGMWYGEISKYDFKRGGFSMDTGHFTQVVWRATARVGCGQSRCNGLQIWVCNYDPPGNVEGEYAANVKPRGCRK